MSSSPRSSHSLRYYFDPRCLTVFGFGIASGFPWVLIGSMLTLWLKDEGLSRSSIGYAGAIFGAYSINYLWSPLIDRVKLPLLSKLGQRRSFILLGNVLIALFCLALSQSNAAENASWVILLALGIAICSASQDIAIDAYRIDSFEADEKPALASGAAMATAGWWTGYAGIGAIPLWLTDAAGLSWQALYGWIAIVPALLAVLVLFRPEPAASSRESHQHQTQRDYRSQLGASPLTLRIRVFASLLAPLGFVLWAVTGFPGIPEISAWGAIATTVGLLMIVNIVWHLHALEQKRQSSLTNSTNKSLSIDGILAWLLVTLVEPFKDFFTRTHVRTALVLLLFIFLFKIGEAFLGRMSIVFYKEIGFSNADIGLYSKMISWWVTIIFSLVGGWFTLKQGIFKGLMIGGLAMAASNLLFAALAMVGPSKALFAGAVIVDGFTTSWSSVAFVAFISMMCSRNFSATQYALLASLGTLGRTLLASNSGAMVDSMGGNWALFFIATSLMVVPALALLFWVRHDIAAIEANSSK